MIRSLIFNKIIHELFYFFGLAWILFFIIELILPNFVLAYFNTNILLILWLFSLFLLLISNSFLLSKKDDR
jgi:hypothetical protein